MKESLPEKVKKIPRPWITTITRLEYNQKDPKTLLKAFSLVLKKFPKASLLICGVGPKEEDLKNYAKELGIDKNVYFLGFQKNPINILKNSDVFVLSSKSERSPIVLIEALLCGTPIISTNYQTGAKSLLKNGKNGEIVSVGDYQKMAEKILIIFRKLNWYKERSKKVAFENNLIYNPEFILKKWKSLLIYYFNKIK